MTEIRKPFSHTSPSPLLRRIRRNRFWLLLYFWLALAVPGVVLCCSCAIDTAPWAGLFALAPALTLFLLCTAIPAPRINYAIALAGSLGWFLFCCIQLFYHRLFGLFLPIRSWMEMTGLFRHEDVLRRTIPDAFPRIVLMGLPLMVFTVMGRKLFSFRPLKRWQQHIPMVIACVLSHLAVLLCLPLLRSTPAQESYTLPEPTALESTVPPAPIFLSSDFSPNQLEMDFTALADDENRDAIASIHRYFSDRSPSNKNTKTGLFRGCNLIQITACLSDQSEITEEQSPILHRMTQESIRFTDYHAFHGAGSFSGDYALLTGTIPVGTVSPELVTYRYQPLTMVQQQIREGYSAWGFHCCDRSTCDDDRFLASMGYECAVARQAPLEALDRWAGSLTERAPFTAWCSFDEPLALGDLDALLSLLTARLRNAGVLDHSVLVLSLACDSERDLCLLWKPGAAPEAVDTPTGPLDLLPTLSNLFGLSFDSRLYMGRDVFGDRTPLVILPDGSWITDQARYDATNGTTLSATDQPLIEGYSEEITRDVQNRFRICAQILQEDYWRILFS